MTPRITWLLAIVVQIIGILLIGDDILTARKKTRQSQSHIVEDGAPLDGSGQLPVKHRPSKAMIGVGFLTAGLILALVAG